ncbi:MAG: replication-associated recombination protein A [Armatimonadota bacterium]
MRGLFEEDNGGANRAEVPLAARMRPRTLDELVGQEEIVGPGTPLRRAIEADRISSCIFWGPPGCGKSTLASIIASSTKASFENFSAVTSGLPEMRAVLARAVERRRRGGRTILFIDEIHRFNKSQQDAFLPYVENGTIILIGATTENPFFEVNAPLLSRCRIYTFRPLSAQHIKEILKRALADKERGLGNFGLEVDNEALEHLSNIANGDARVALNALEAAANDAVRTGTRRIDLQLAEAAAQQRALRYDKSGDQHYDIISAFIKSMRGSDPDAAVYWLLRMLESGEDPRFIARRMVIHAAEDVGLADPMALVVAVSAAHALEFVGLPEAKIPMVEAAIYIACAPKSNSVVKAIGAVGEDLSKQEAQPVPVHLRGSEYFGAARLGHGLGYLYPHDFPNGYVPQQYLPDNLVGRRYYEPTDRGYEAEIKKRLERLRGMEQNKG